MESKTPGYVYILTNPSFREDWVKIGMTKNMEERMRNLDNTSVPLPFKKYATLQTVKYEKAEKHVHHFIETFTKLRVRDKREFFKVTPEQALNIFCEVAELLDDAVVIRYDDEGHPEPIYPPCPEKPANTVPLKTDKTPSVELVSRVWLLPSNPKFFDLKGYLNRYGNEIYWRQHVNFQPGDTGYMYSALPDRAIRYKFEVIETNLPYSLDMEKEREFNVTPGGFEELKKHNRFVLLRITGYTQKRSMELDNLRKNGLKQAPQGAMILSNSEHKKLLKYIEENF